MKILKNLEKLLFASALLLIPTQLAMHFWPPTSLVFGIRVDYLAPTIYLVDTVLIALLITWFFIDIKFIRSFLINNKKQIFVALLFVIANIMVSVSPLITSIKFFKVLEMSLFALYVSRRLFVFGKNKAIVFIALSSIPVSVVGIAQFFLGHTVGGLLYFFGERSFTLSTPGIALVQLGGIDHLRAYSFFPHPNALAGYLAVSALLLIYLGVKRGNMPRIVFVLISTCVVLAFSLSSVISLLIIFTIYFFSKTRYLTESISRHFVLLIVLLSLLMPFVSSYLLNTNFTFPDNISERMSLSVSSAKIISEHFLFGVGLNQFIPNLQSVVVGSGATLLLQPVHNIFLLIAAEMGIVGLILISGLFNILIKKLVGRGAVFGVLILVFIGLTGLLDHYWITINQNMLLIALCVGCLFSKEHSSSSPKYI